MADKVNSKIYNVFASSIYQGALPPRQAMALNKHLQKEIYTLAELDEDGQRWSKTNYVNGYSSYSSLCKLHETSPYFADLEKLLKPHVNRLTKKLQWDLLGRKITMTTCWANAMEYGSYHTLHLHPFSVLSGVYYVSTPKGSSPLKLEDPRMSSFMAAPPRKATAPAHSQPYITIPSQAGQFVLFEGWMRHEVPPHLGEKPRLSISFNFEWI